VTGEGIKVRAGARRRPSLVNLIRQTSGNPVEVTELDAGQELAPFIYREFIDRCIRIVRVADENTLTPTCNSDARTTIAST
jgi:hypothetical protein